MPTRVSTGRPHIGSQSASLLPPFENQLLGLENRAELPAVVTVTVTDVELEPLSVTELGESEHVECAGAPLQFSDTG